MWNQDKQAFEEDEEEQEDKDDQEEEEEEKQDDEGEVRERTTGPTRKKKKSDCPFDMKRPKRAHYGSTVRSKAQTIAKDIKTYGLPPGKEINMLASKFFLASFPCLPA